MALDPKHTDNYSFYYANSFWFKNCASTDRAISQHLLGAGVFLTPYTFRHKPFFYSLFLRHAKKEPRSAAATVGRRLRRRR